MQYERRYFSIGGEFETIVVKLGGWGPCCGKQIDLKRRRFCLFTFLELEDFETGRRDFERLNRCYAMMGLN